MAVLGGGRKNSGSIRRRGRVTVLRHRRLRVAVQSNIQFPLTVPLGAGKIVQYMGGERVAVLGGRVTLLGVRVEVCITRMSTSGSMRREEGRVVVEVGE